MSKACRPIIEALESRRLLSATVWAYSASGHDSEGLRGSAYADSTGDHGGGFTVFSSSVDFGEVDVPYVVSGTAKGPGAPAGQQDHTLVNGVVRVSTSPYGGLGYISFDTLRDNLIEGAESVTITLQPGEGYQIGPRPAGTATGIPQYDGPTPATTSFTIDDDPPVVRVSAVDPYAAEPTSSTAANAGVFRVSRNGGDLTEPLEVYLEVGGTATPAGADGADYAFSSNAEITHSLPVPPRTPPAMAAISRDPIRPPNRGPLAPPPTYVKVLLPAVPQGLYLSEADVVVTPVADSNNVETDESITFAATRPTGVETHKVAPVPEFDRTIVIGGRSGFTDMGRSGEDRINWMFKDDPTQNAKGGGKNDQLPGSIQKALKPEYETGTTNGVAWARVKAGTGELIVDRSYTGVKPGDQGFGEAGSEHPGQRVYISEELAPLLDKHEHGHVSTTKKIYERTAGLAADAASAFRNNEFMGRPGESEAAVKQRLMAFIDWDARLKQFSEVDIDENKRTGWFHAWETNEGGGPRSTPFAGVINGVHYDAIFFSRFVRPIDANDTHYHLPDYEKYDPWEHRDQP